VSFGSQQESGFKFCGFVDFCLFVALFERKKKQINKPKKKMNESAEERERE